MYSYDILLNLRLHVCPYQTLLLFGLSLAASQYQYFVSFLRAVLKPEEPLLNYRIKQENNHANLLNNVNEFIIDHGPYEMYFQEFSCETSAFKAHIVNKGQFKSSLCKVFLYSEHSGLFFHLHSTCQIISRNADYKTRREVRHRYCIIVGNKPLGMRGKAITLCIALRSRNLIPANRGLPFIAISTDYNSHSVEVFLPY